MSYLESVDEMSNAKNNDKKAEKLKVTVTLDKDLIDQIDKEVKNRTFSSRSNAIEVLLRSYVPTLDSALFLLSVDNILFSLDRELPMIMTELENLIKQGIKFIVIYYHKSDAEFYKSLQNEIIKLEERYEGSRIILDYTYDSQGDAASILPFHKKYASNSKTILVVHGTVLRGLNNSKINYQSIFNYHLHNESDLTMVVGDLAFFDPKLTVDGAALIENGKNPGEQGRVLLEGTHVKAVRKFEKDELDVKRNLESLEGHLMNSSLVDIGIYFIDSTLIDFIKVKVEKSKDKYASFTKRDTYNKSEKSVIDELIEHGHDVSGYVFSGYWNHYRRFIPENED